MSSPSNPNNTGRRRLFTYNQSPKPATRPFDRSNGHGDSSANRQLFHQYQGAAGRDAGPKEQENRAGRDSTDAIDSPRTKAHRAGFHIAPLPQSINQKIELLQKQGKSLSTPNSNGDTQDETNDEDSLISKEIHVIRQIPDPNFEPVDEGGEVREIEESNIGSVTGDGDFNVGQDRNANASEAGSTSGIKNGSVAVENLSGLESVEEELKSKHEKVECDKTTTAEAKPEGHDINGSAGAVSNEEETDQVSPTILPQNEEKKSDSFDSEEISFVGDVVHEDATNPFAVRNEESDPALENTPNPSEEVLNEVTSTICEDADKTNAAKHDDPTNAGGNLESSVEGDKSDRKIAMEARKASGTYVESSAEEDNTDRNIDLEVGKAVGADETQSPIHSTQSLPQTVFENHQNTSVNEIQQSLSDAHAAFLNKVSTTELSLPPDEFSKWNADVEELDDSPSTPKKDFNSPSESDTKIISLGPSFGSCSSKETIKTGSQRIDQVNPPKKKTSWLDFLEVGEDNLDNVGQESGVIEQAARGEIVAEKSETSKTGTDEDANEWCNYVDTEMPSSSTKNLSEIQGSNGEKEEKKTEDEAVSPKPSKSREIVELPSPDRHDYSSDEDKYDERQDHFNQEEYFVSLDEKVPSRNNDKAPRKMPNRTLSSTSLVDLLAMQPISEENELNEDMKGYNLEETVQIAESSDDDDDVSGVSSSSGRSNSANILDDDTTNSSDVSVNSQGGVEAKSSSFLPSSDFSVDSQADDGGKPSSFLPVVEFEGGHDDGTKDPPKTSQNRAMRKSSCSTGSGEDSGSMFFLTSIQSTENLTHVSDAPSYDYNSISSPDPTESDSNEPKDMGEDSPNSEAPKALLEAEPDQSVEKIKSVSQKYISPMERKRSQEKIKRGQKVDVVDSTNEKKNNPIEMKHNEGTAGPSLNAMPVEPCNQKFISPMERKRIQDERKLRVSQESESSTPGDPPLRESGNSSTTYDTAETGEPSKQKYVSPMERKRMQKERKLRESQESESSPPENPPLRDSGTSSITFETADTGRNMATVEPSKQKYISPTERKRMQDERKLRESQQSESVPTEKSQTVAPETSALSDNSQSLKAKNRTVSDEFRGLMGVSKAHYGGKSKGIMSRNTETKLRKLAKKHESKESQQEKSKNLQKKEDEASRRPIGSKTHATDEQKEKKMLDMPNVTVAKLESQTKSTTTSNQKSTKSDPTKGDDSSTSSSSASEDLVFGSSNARSKDAKDWEQIRRQRQLVRKNSMEKRKPKTQETAESSNRSVTSAISSDSRSQFKSRGKRFSYRSVRNPRQTDSDDDDDQSVVSTTSRLGSFFSTSARNLLGWNNRKESDAEVESANDDDASSESSEEKEEDATWDMNILTEGEYYLAMSMLVYIYALLRATAMLGHTDIPFDEIDVNSFQSEVGCGSSSSILGKTKSAGFIVRVVMDELEKKGAFSIVDKNDNNVSIMREFKKWVHDSRVKQLDHATEGTIKQLRRKVARMRWRRAITAVRLMVRLGKSASANRKKPIQQRSALSAASNRRVNAAKRGLSQSMMWLTDHRDQIMKGLGIKGSNDDLQSISNEEDVNSLVKKSDIEDIIDDALEQPRFFREGSLMSNLIESGIEIAWFSDRHPNDVVYSICCNRQQKRVSVVFRGTVNSHNWFMNMKFAMTEHANPITEDYPGRTDVFGLHTGFSLYMIRQRKDDSLTKVEEIFSKIDAIGREIAPDGKYELSITGHSLGGALATIIGFFAATSHILSNLDTIRIFTYAAPRVGCQRFVYAFQHLERQGKLRVARFSNTRDIVPLIPFRGTGWTYKHVGMHVRLHGVHSFAQNRLRKALDVTYPKFHGILPQIERGFWSCPLLNLTNLKGYIKNHTLSEYQKRIHFALEYRSALAITDFFHDKKRNRVKTLDEYYFIRGATSSTSTSSLTRVFLEERFKASDKRQSRLVALALFLLAMTEALVLLNMFETSIPCESFPLILYPLYPFIGCSKEAEKECGVSTEKVETPSFMSGYSGDDKSFGLPDMSFRQDDVNTKENQSELSLSHDGVEQQIKESSGSLEHHEEEISAPSEIQVEENNSSLELQMEFKEEIVLPEFQMIGDMTTLELQPPCLWGCHTSLQHTNLFWGVISQRHKIPSEMYDDFSTFFSQQVLWDAQLDMKEAGIDRSEISTLVRDRLRKLATSLIS